MESGSQDSRVWVVIPASGVGSRMKSEVPKQYLSVQGCTILEHTINRFADLPELAGVLVVVSQLDSYWETLKKKLDEKYRDKGFLLHSTIGGDERSESVLNGLNFLSGELNVELTQWVMVHDAARPCVKQLDLKKLLTIRFDFEKDGGILATPVKDTLKRVNANNNIILETQTREAMWQAQTPQMFRLGALIESLTKAKQAGVSITDEASAMEYNNKQVQLVEGSSDNFKLTTPADLRVINFLLKDSE